MRRGRMHYALLAPLAKASLPALRRDLLRHALLRTGPAGPGRRVQPERRVVEVVWDLRRDVERTAEVGGGCRRRRQRGRDRGQQSSRGEAEGRREGFRRARCGAGERAAGLELEHVLMRKREERIDRRAT